MDVIDHLGDECHAKKYVQQLFSVYLKFDVFVLQNLNVEAYCRNCLDIFLTIVLQSVCKIHRN